MTVRAGVKAVEKLNNELFRKIERSQGYFFVSDGEEFPTVDAYLDRLRGRLEHGEAAVKIMRDFIKKHSKVRP